MSKKTTKEDLDNVYYKKYLLQKEKLKKKYNPKIFKDEQKFRDSRDTDGIDKDNKEYKKYISELMDIICKADSPYQKFVWDTLPNYEQTLRDHISRDKKSTAYEK